jgi:hypothetical protein
MALFGIPLKFHVLIVHIFYKIATLGSNRIRILCTSCLGSKHMTKPHVPGIGRWGLAYVLCGAFVFHPPGSQRGLRAKNCEASYSNGQEKRRKTEIRALEPRSLREQQEYWNDGISSFPSSVAGLLRRTGADRPR